MAKRLAGLGKGLGALIPQKSQETAVEPRSEVATVSPAPTEEKGSLLHVPIDSVVANTEQPRSTFGHRELEELVESIREHGILQPLTVSPKSGGGYELIAGERRLRAARMLGLKTVPVVIRTAEAHDRLILALIENLQREDLNALEEAKAYTRLISEFGLTQENVSKKVGKARSTVANTVRLLELPSEIQEAISAGKVSAGSARALIGIEDKRRQMKLFRKLVSGGLSVRQTEKEVRRTKTPRKKDPALAAAEERLRNALGSRVGLSERGGKGKITIDYHSPEERERLVERLSA
jgi:ParB family chromosome partitioning protein